ncbi:MAG TPA: glycosyltransferase family 4 protein [Bacteroidales bacterium]|jgi:glycosyltransferase involved in cell wall biosynthesis|nr:Glycogen synthase [Bacteroidales bacterium]OQC55847.1 MAG: Glycogen synthase [Bacteroidetes bacterium ADurb.Bin013]HNR27069.1 glycosyltransferase family 4 protein [Bacteroidales bacterium]HNW21538.1 glycosyltransferase family 4 protein [Bacteroidales bacterium]HNZ45650.1 glycosyltransferase family 4 protein [Bacteroidales bacterium]
MKVLMFGWEFPPHISGGLGTACDGLTRGLAKHNVQVLFVMPSASGDEDQSAVRIINASDVAAFETREEARQLFEKVQFLKVTSNLIPYLGPDEFEEKVDLEREKEWNEFRISFGQKFKFSGKYGKNLMEEVMRYALVASAIAHKNQFDVIHAHDWLTYMAGIAAKRVSGKPLVVHVHATEYDRSGENINTQVYDLERRGMEAADRVIAVSNLTRNTIITRYHIDPSKVITVHNAVDFSTVEDREITRGVPEKIVTFLGRITFQKGPEYFIEAAYKVLQKTKDVRFVMAGSGDLFNRAIRRVAKLGISPHFHFTGFLRGEDVKNMFAYSDVYVMPSVSEPFGISPLEAMRANVPTIISKQSGVAEVLRHAIKVDFWDVNAMADAIYGLLTYPALSAMTVRCGLEEVNALKWDNAALKVKEIYESVTEEK